MALSNKDDKIKYLVTLILELEAVLVSSIAEGHDRNEETEEEMALFDMLKSGVRIMETRYKVQYGKISKEDAAKEHRAAALEVAGLTEDDVSSENVFELLSDDKKKLVN